MNFVIYGKNIEITDNLRKAIEDKLGKLERYFTPDTKVNVTLSVEKERQKIEVTIPVKGSIIRSEQVSNDMYVSIDLVEEVIERQLHKYKSKIIDRHQAGGNMASLSLSMQRQTRPALSIRARTVHTGFWNRKSKAGRYKKRTDIEKRAGTYVPALFVNAGGNGSLLY